MVDGPLALKPLAFKPPVSESEPLAAKCVAAKSVVAKLLTTSSLLQKRSDGAREVNKVRDEERLVPLCEVRSHLEGLRANLG